MNKLKFGNSLVIFRAFLKIPYRTNLKPAFSNSSHFTFIHTSLSSNSLDNSYKNASPTSQTTQNDQNGFIIIDEPCPTSTTSEPNTKHAYINPKASSEYQKRILTPQQTVSLLDRHVIGQNEAKKSVAIALRNRQRRQLLDKALQKEVYPSNILMVGSTGTGKTEIARRLAKIAKAPFVKVEVTRYTEVGVVGSNTEDCIKELVDNAYAMELDETRTRIKASLNKDIEKTILRALKTKLNLNINTESMLRNYRDGLYDDVYIDIKLPSRSEQDKNVSKNPKSRVRLSKPLNVFANKSDARFIENLFEQLKQVSGSTTSILGQIGSDNDTRDQDFEKENVNLSVKNARKRLESVYESKHIDYDEVVRLAIKRAEESGIVFLDEIDKLVSRSLMESSTGSSQSSSFQKGEGVQKELLSLVEGTQIETDYGTVKTDHMLFIASGAFHRCQPSDLMPELQGRLPIKVKLNPLSMQDFIRIMSETEYNLIDQHISLLKTENVHLNIDKTAIDEIAHVSSELNRSVQDIGARRLRAVIAKVIEDISFEAPYRSNESVLIDRDYVRAKLKDYSEQIDINKYVW